MIMVVLLPTHLKILDEISLHDPGISFNVLAKRLKGKVSRVILSREIKKLISLSLIEVVPDPSHKQRLFYRIRDEVRRLIDDLRIARTSNLDQILSDTVKSLKSYAQRIREVKDDALKEYMRHQLLKSIEESLILLEGNKYG